MHVFNYRILQSEKFAISVVEKHFGVRNIAEHVSRRYNQSPIDFIMLDKKYDVKFANPSMVNQTDRQPVWDFDMRGKTNYCDFLVLIGMIDDQPRRVYLVPGAIAPSHHIRVSINGTSKWHEYLIWSWK